MKDFLLDLIFPITCLGCSIEGEFLCSSCLKKIPLNQELPREKLIVAADYQNPLIKESVHRFKYSFIKELSKPLGKIMSQKLINYISGDSNVLIPIPLHRKRLKWRGFNQSELLAREIGKELNMPVIDSLLIRKKNTLPQAKIENAIQRKENIKNVFGISSSFDLTDKTVILIDDISTTGATLKESARVLKPLKPKQIWGLVLARG